MKIKTKQRSLATGYTAEVDCLDEKSWNEFLSGFTDAIIYQAWGFAAEVGNRHKISHLVLRRHGEIVSMALIKCVTMPWMRYGFASVFWGPLWRRQGKPVETEIFAQAVRALRNEYACRQKMTLRLQPGFYFDDPLGLKTILKEEDYEQCGVDARGRTILMSLNRPLNEIRQSMNSHWTRNLKKATNRQLEVSDGVNDNLFEDCVAIFEEMVARKHFKSNLDIYQYRNAQKRLPDSLKMKILVCHAEGTLCACVIYTDLGEIGFPLFAATADRGMDSRGSYLLQWIQVENLKRNGCSIFDLNGIDPENNPGTYRFKAGFAGEAGIDTHYGGSYCTHGGVWRYAVYCGGQWLRAMKGRILRLRQSRR